MKRKFKTIPRSSFKNGLRLKGKSGSDFEMEAFLIPYFHEVLDLETLLVKRIWAEQNRLAEWF